MTMAHHFDPSRLEIVNRSEYLRLLRSVPIGPGHLSVVSDDEAAELRRTLPVRSWLPMEDPRLVRVGVDGGVWSPGESVHARVSGPE